MRRLCGLLLLAGALVALLALVRRSRRATSGLARVLPPDVEAAIAGERPALAQQRGRYHPARLIASDGRLVHAAPASAVEPAPLVLYSSWHEPLASERDLGSDGDVHPSLVAAEAYARALVAACGAGDGAGAAARELWRGWEHVDGRTIGAIELVLDEPAAEMR
ncbi:MAG: hypothetical protein FJ035_09045 [Chloroflexi bacterium]|nr:hypothetical protein [Chloroflexota bacterium]